MWCNLLTILEQKSYDDERIIGWYRVKHIQGQELTHHQEPMAPAKAKYFIFVQQRVVALTTFRISCRVTQTIR